MTTKRDICLQAGRDLGDTSANFITDILAPAFDDVMSDLTSAECVEAVRRRETFIIELDKRDHETRELCKLTPHYPLDIINLRVWPWGLPDAKVPRANNQDEFDNFRLLSGEAKRGRWRIWHVWPNHRLLQVHPPAGPDEAGTECEIIFAAPWRSIALDEDVLDLEQEDISTVVLGIKKHGATFSEMLQSERQLALAEYEAAKRKMWGRRWVHSGNLGQRRA